MADTELTISSGGLAFNAAGTLADMPRDLAHEINGDLLHVLALIHCCRNEIPESAEEAAYDDDELHDASSRAIVLSAIAEEKIRKVIRSMSPYV